MILSRPPNEAKGAREDPALSPHEAKRGLREDPALSPHEAKGGLREDPVLPFPLRYPQRHPDRSYVSDSEATFVLVSWGEDMLLAKISPAPGWKGMVLRQLAIGN